MKKVRNIIHWLYIQAYVMFAIIFFSKEKLMTIAREGNNHPLIVLTMAKWTRIWWFSLLAILVWFIALFPYINLIYFGNKVTFFSEVTYNDEIIYFGAYAINIYIVILAGVLIGKLLLLLEIHSSNKMNYVKRYVRMTHDAKKPQQLNPVMKKLE